LVRIWNGIEILETIQNLVGAGIFTASFCENHIGNLKDTSLGYTKLPFITCKIWFEFAEKYWYLRQHLPAHANMDREAIYKNF
jgi:hypothetical protein